MDLYNKIQSYIFEYQSTYQVYVNIDQYKLDILIFFIENTDCFMSDNGDLQVFFLFLSVI